MPSERIAPGTLEALERHDWPGNIRELENVIQRALVIAREGTLDLTGFIGEPLDIEEVPRQSGRLRPLVDVEGDYILFGGRQSFSPPSPVTFTNPNIQSFRKCTRFMHSTR